MDLTPYIVHPLVLFLAIVSFFLVVLIIVLGRLIAPRKAYGYILAALIPIAWLLSFRPATDARPLTRSPWMDMLNWLLNDPSSPVPDSVQSSVAQIIAALRVRDWTLNLDRFVYGLREGIVSSDLIPILLLFSTFVIFLILGVKDSKTYEKIFKGRKFLWFMFGLVVVGLVSSLLRTDVALLFLALLLFYILAVLLLVGVKDTKTYTRIFEGRKFAWFTLGLFVVGLAWLVLSPLKTEATVLFLALFSFLLVVLILLLGRLIGPRKGYSYILATLIPIAWLLSPMFLIGVSSRHPLWGNLVHVLRYEVASLYMIPILLLFFIFAAFLIVGIENNDTYTDIFKHRQFVWFVFGLVVFGLVWFVPTTFFNASQRIEGLHAMTADVRDGIQELSGFSSTLKTYAGRSPAPGDVGRYVRNIQVWANNLDAQLTSVLSTTETLSNSVKITNTGSATYTQEALRQVDQLGTQIPPLVDEVLATTESISKAQEIDPAGWEKIRFLADEIDDKAERLQPTIAILTLDRTIPFLMISALFVVFLLIPWLLYLCFILGKRKPILFERRRTLEHLGLLDEFLKEPPPRSDLKQVAAYESRWYLSRAVKAVEEVDSLETLGEQLVTICKQMAQREEQKHYQDVSESWEQTQRTLMSVLETLEQAPENVAGQRRLTDVFGPDKNKSDWNFRSKFQPGEKDKILNALDDNKSAAIDEIIKQRTFFSREYVIPLLILTALTLVGWYYIIFPKASAGLLEFVRSGATLQELTRLLTADFTTFTMTFAGAWLFVIVMLTYRWVTDDLYPKSYFYASMRMVYALLVGWVFTRWVGQFSNKNLLLLVAFFVGAAPLEAVRAAWRWIKNKLSDGDDAGQATDLGGFVKHFEVPDWKSRYPLTELEDLTIWDDTRLYQEGIQNVHALATADLLRLVLRTPFDTQQLMDWVDQAVLYIHVKDLWRIGLSALGVRTATDLYEVTHDEEGNRPEKRVRRVVDAFNYVQLMHLLQLQDPRYAAYDAASKLEVAGKDLGEKATAVKEAAAKLDEGSLATLDNVIALRDSVNAIAADKVEVVQNAREPVYTALTEAGESGEDNELLKAWQADGAVAGKLSALAAPHSEANQAVNERDEKGEYKLTREKLGHSDEAVQKAARDALTKAKEQAGALSTAVTEAKNTIQTARDSVAKKYTDKSGAPLAKAEAALAEIESLYTLVTTANDVAKHLDKDEEMTWDNVKALHDDLTHLKEKVEKIKTERVDLKEKLDALTKQQTLALREAIKKVDEVSTQDAAAKADEAVAAFKDLSASSDSDKLAAAKETVAEAVTQSEKLKTAADAAAEEAMRSSLPIRLTEAILQIVLDSMQSDPNIKHLRLFWQQRKQEPTRALLAGGEATILEDEFKMRLQEVEERISTAQQALAEEENTRTKQVQGLQTQVEKVEGHARAQLDALEDQVTREQGKQRQAALTTLRADVDKALNEVKTHSEDLVTTAQALQAALEAESAAQKRVTELENQVSEQEKQEKALEEALGQIAGLNDQVSEQEKILKEAQQQIYDLKRLSLEAYDASLEDIEGIDPGNLGKLKELGITNVGKLLAKCITPGDRWALAKEMKISEALLLGWANRADLSRISGVGKEYADLLEEADVDTVPELAQRNAGNLVTKLEQVNKGKKLVERLPTLEEVASWTAQAKKLPRILEYEI